MFDENQIVEITWRSNNKQHFINTGYKFTKIGDILRVSAKDLLPKSCAKVKCICDYCGKEYDTVYSAYNKSKKRGKIACKNCKQLKRADSFMKKFGASSPGGSDICRQKARIAMKELYGAEYAMQTELGQEKFKQTMFKTYGCENPSFSSELLHKSRITAYNNGTYVSSKPERELVKMLCQLYGEENCIPGYPVDRVALDCLLLVDGVKIDIEYDGGYWHQNTKDADRKRNHWLMSIGYKVIRILGNPKDDLPSLDRIKEEVDYILSGHNIGYIDMNS